MRILANARHALRLLAHSPLFALTAVTSLAAGIAASTAIFSLTDALLWRPPGGITDAGRVVDIGRAAGNGQGFDNFGYPLFRILREQSTSFESMAATTFATDTMSLGEGGPSERVSALLVSDNYFHVLGTRVATGRFFLPEEGRTAGERPVVVLSHAFWQRRFAGRQDIVGTTIELNGLAYTIVGVAQPSFTGMTVVAPDFWVPMEMAHEVRGNPSRVLKKRPPPA